MWVRHSHTRTHTHTCTSGKVNAKLAKVKFVGFYDLVKRHRTALPPFCCAAGTSIEVLLPTCQFHALCVCVYA